jgi:hypothetical protein
MSLRRSAPAALVLAAVALADAQPQPLPAAEPFLAEARKRLASNALLQSRFTFRERVTEISLNPLGRMGTGPVHTYEVFPVDGGEMTYKRLIERDGRPVPRAEIAAQDRKFLAKYRSWQRELASEGKSEREARLRKQAEEEARDRKQAAEVTALFAFHVERRELLRGSPAIVVSFRPKPGIQPHSREARIASSFAGMAWVHEHEFEVMRVEAESMSDTNYGGGVIARLHKGARALLTREKIGDAWLPMLTQFSGTGRALLLRRMNIEFRREYSDYRPFDPSQLLATLAASSTGNN